MPPTAYEVYQDLEREEQFAPQEGKTQSSYSSWRERAMNRNMRKSLAIIGTCWLIYILWLNRLYASSWIPGSPNNSDEVAYKETVGKTVPLDVHIMSKCPDAKDCLQKLILPAMEQISDKVDFKLSFIGSTSDIECKHGPTECIGNMLMLCAANLPFPSSQISTPRTPVIRSLGFANCLIDDYPEIPSRALVQNCALEHGVDFEALNACASREDDDFENPGDPTPEDPSGIALLRKSVRHTHDVGVTKSCTVRLDETIWCIRDNGQWKDCAHGSDVSTFVGEVERLWKERN
uniref:GILT-like protein C02D5.2 n=1 Tax=Talaromyces marneffei PM1 TaxID=1077442 RepID=A0A093UZP2_TALMA